MTRLLTLDEVVPVVEPGCAQPDNRNIYGGLDTAYFLKRLVDLVKRGTAFVIGLFGDDGATVQGALAYFIVDDIFNSDKVATQCFWFTYQPYRGRGVLLLREYEKQARLAGCKRMSMPHELKRQPKEFGKFFERYGYSASEVAYVKLLTEN